MIEKVCYSVFLIIHLFSTNSHALMEVNMDSGRFPLDRELLENVLDPELCQRQLTHLTSNVGLLARFLDAGLRVPRGILMGNTMDFGNFHQCLAINEVVEDMEINGKYCRIRVPVNQDFSIPGFLDRSLMKFDPSELKIDENTLRHLEVLNSRKIVQKSPIIGTDVDTRLAPDSPFANISFNLAICIPRPCTTRQAINDLLFNLTDIGFEFSDVSCRLPDDRPWVAADYVASVVFSIIGILTVISTFYDLHQCMYLKKGAKEISPAYTAFSVWTNTRRLLTFNSSPGSLECLDGVRALAMMWVILGHSFFTITEANNPIEMFQWSISPQAIWITVGPLTVDTFFFLSGLLLVYTTAGKLGRTQLLKNLHVFYLNRLLRMFPVLAAVVLFEASFLMRLSDGPLWDRVAVLVLRCREFWWSTLLHLQNLVNPREACVGVTWYLAIDIQLHILSPIVLFWVLTSKRAAWIALLTSLVAILSGATIFNFIQNFQSGIISPNRQIETIDFYTFYYVNILTRASPFFVGMIYGYLLHLWRKKKLHIHPILTVLLLICSIGTVLVVIYCSYIAMRMDWENQLADNFFNSFLRPMWALGLGWIVFACVQGHAEPINWFLSLRMWKLPARLSYAMYLIHLSLMMVFYSSIFAPVHFSVSSTMFNFMAFIFITTVVSFFLTLLIDSPFSTIFKLLLDRGYKKPQPSKTALKENESANDGINKTGYTFADAEDNKKHQP